MTTLAVAGLGFACRTPTSRLALSLDVIAERYVRLTLEFAQHQPSLVEAWFGPQAWLPGPRRPVAELLNDLNTLRDGMPRLSAGDGSDERHAYLQQQIAALIVAARRLSGESMSFADEARAAFGDDVARFVESTLRDAGSDAERVAAREVLDERLPGKGALHERYAKFRRAHAIADDRVLPTLTAAMEFCRREVIRHISLPAGEHVELTTASGLGLQGLASYAGAFRSRVQFDASGGLDLARLVWLVAHETYPGHHLQHVLAAPEVMMAKAWYERALQPAFGAHLLVAEGAAETGAALLLDNDAFANVCRELTAIARVSADVVHDLVAVQRAVAGLDTIIIGVAQQYLDGAIGSEAAAEQLEIEALVANPRPFLFTIERQRTRLLAYPIGRRLVSSRVLAAPHDRQWERLAHISTSLTLPVSSLS